MSSTSDSISPAPGYINTRPKEDCWSYPRPPLLEKTPLRLRVVWYDAEGKETLVADTKDGYRVCETTHPPTYYIPPADVNETLLKKTARSSFCEFKGIASYYNFIPPTPTSGSKHPTVENRIWNYLNPTKKTDFVGKIDGYYSFYAGTGMAKGRGGWKCFVEGEEVVAQDGDFYGGWKTEEIVGRMKGGPGTYGW